MWEKSNGMVESKQELYPQARVLPKARKSAAGDEQLLFVQMLLCVAIAAFLAFSRASDAPWIPALRAQCEQALTQGVSFSTENEVARLASKAVRQLRVSAQAWMEQLDRVQETSMHDTSAETESVAASEILEESVLLNGQGGLWPVKKRQVPDGATLDAYTLTQTLTLPVQGVFTSAYGFRTHPITGEEDFHMGIDLAAAEYTAVKCALAGQVVESAYNSQRGNYIIVRHDDGVQTLYQHLSYVFLRTGERVAQGQVLGTVGSTGMSTGPHLHFELIVNGVRVNPALALPTLA
jgi:murein DD-endopeptidase MepM/ murein hydrolase activator NlpD